MTLLYSQTRPLLNYIHVLSRRVDVQLRKNIVSKDSSNETHVDITESVRGKDVFIMQSGYG